MCVFNRSHLFNFLFIHFLLGKRMAPPAFCKAASAKGTKNFFVSKIRLTQNVFCLKCSNHTFINHLIKIYKVILLSSSHLFTRQETRFRCIKLAAKVFQLRQDTYFTCFEQYSCQGLCPEEYAGASGLKLSNAHQTSQNTLALPTANQRNTSNHYHNLNNQKKAKREKKHRRRAEGRSKRSETKEETKNEKNSQGEEWRKGNKSKR